MAKHEAMDTETVAGLLDVSTRQITNYINLKGMPSHGLRTKRTFVWKEVLDWYVDYKSSNDRYLAGDGDEAEESGADGSEDGSSGKKEDIRAANLRKTRAEANLKELHLGRLRGQVISIPDAKTRLDRMMGNLRAKLLGIAPKLASRLEAERDRAGREAVLKSEMENLCREISTGAVVDLPKDTELVLEAAGPEDGEE